MAAADATPVATLTGRRAVALTVGEAEGPLLWTDVGLSFWGGVDPASGRVVDRHHPLHGADLCGRVLALPSGRGSCTGSSVLLETLLNGCAPAAIVVCDPEEILTLGALVGEMVFGRTLPVVRVDRDVFAALGRYRRARIGGGQLRLSEPSGAEQPGSELAIAMAPAGDNVRLSAADRAMLEGREGAAVAIAMRLLQRMAAIQGAGDLLDVSQVHIDGCVYTGAASLRFAQWMAQAGGRVRVPTTLNAISVDQRHWRALGVDPALGEPSATLAETYLAMGAQPTFTCAPYLLATAPKPGEQIGWAESNAVVFANSVLGARTAKYPDFLDLCIALTGRAPAAGCHTDAGRRATLAIEVEWPAGADDAVWPLLGYCCGAACGGEIPLVRGLEEARPEIDDFKAFGAAFATMASAPMFHIAGVTAEAGGQAPERRRRIALADLARTWDELNTAAEAAVDLVSLGNPHLSVAEFRRLAGLVRGRARSPDVAVVVTCGRAVRDAAADAGFVAVLEGFGALIVTDTCWCMLGEPVVPPHARTLMTNSGKYAHYAPGLTGRSVRFGSLADCVEAACTGRCARERPAWLGGA